MKNLITLILIFLGFIHPSITPAPVATTTVIVQATTSPIIISHQPVVVKKVVPVATKNVPVQVVVPIVNQEIQQPIMVNVLPLLSSYIQFNTDVENIIQGNNYSILTTGTSYTRAQFFLSLQKQLQDEMNVLQSSNATTSVAYAKYSSLYQQHLTDYNAEENSYTNLENVNSAQNQQYQQGLIRSQIIQDTQEIANLQSQIDLGTLTTQQHMAANAEIDQLQAQVQIDQQ